MSERRGIWSLFANPVIYEAFHTVIGARRWMERFARDTIRARAGEHVLDIGCGQAALLNFLPAVTYIGLDRNKAGIERAERTYGGRGRFICDDLANIDKYGLPPIDLAVAIGVLHHIDDDLALNVLNTTARILRPGGRLVTADPCFHPE